MPLDEAPVVSVQVPILEHLMPDDSPPLIVAYDIRDLLANIQRGVDAANSALALKADKADLEAAKRQLHGRIDEVQHDLSGVKDDVSGVKQDLARGKGWREGAVVIAGLLFALVVALVLYIVTH